MGSETRRNLLRVATNYIRLLLNLTLGILLVRLLLRGVGTDGFGLIGLLIGILSDLMYVFVDPRIDFASRET